LAPESGETALAERLINSATAEGADALGASGGRLEPGWAADFFTVDLDDLSIAGGEPQSLLTNLVFSAERSTVKEVFVGGRQVIVNGRHELQTDIVNRFKEVQRRLWG